MLPIILYIFAFVLAVVAAFFATVGPRGDSPPWHLSPGWAAFAFFVAAILADKGVF